MTGQFIHHGLFEKLPDHLIREKIIPFTYNIQNQCILEDIKSFYHARYYLLSILLVFFLLVF